MEGMKASEEVFHGSFHDCSHEISHGSNGSFRGGNRSFHGRYCHGSLGSGFGLELGCFRRISVKAFMEASSVEIVSVDIDSVQVSVKAFVQALVEFASVDAHV